MFSVENPGDAKFLDLILVGSRGKTGKNEGSYGANTRPDMVWIGL